MVSLKIHNRYVPLVFLLLLTKESNIFVEACQHIINYCTSLNLTCHSSEMYVDFENEIPNNIKQVRGDARTTWCLLDNANRLKGLNSDNLKIFDGLNSILPVCTIYYNIHYTYCIYIIYRYIGIYMHICIYKYIGIQYL